METTAQGSPRPSRTGDSGTVADRQRIPRNELRNLTVSSVHREYPGSTQSKHSWVPGLRLNGQWLGRIGFPTGQKVQLRIQYGRIVITRIGVALASDQEEQACLTRK